MGRGTERKERETSIGRSVTERRERETKITIMFRGARNGNQNQNFVPERKWKCVPWIPKFFLEIFGNFLPG